MEGTSQKWLAESANDLVLLPLGRPTGLNNTDLWAYRRIQCLHRRTWWQAIELQNKSPVWGYPFRQLAGTSAERLAPMGKSRLHRHSYIRPEQLIRPRSARGELVAPKDRKSVV